MLDNEANVTIKTEPRFHPWGVTQGMLQTERDVTYVLFLKRISEYRMQLAPRSGTGYLVPSTKMVDHLEEIILARDIHSRILSLIHSEDLATLHYYGGLATENYTNPREKMAFLQLLFDIGYSTKE